MLAAGRWPNIPQTRDQAGSSDRIDPNPLARMHGMRLTLAMLLTAVATGLVGCSTCQHPYDYCGPTFSGPGGHDPCLINERAGSAFTGTMLPQPMPQDVEEPFSEPSPEQPIPPGEYETVPADCENLPPLESSSSAPIDPVVQPVTGMARRPTSCYRR